MPWDNRRKPKTAARRLLDSVEWRVTIRNKFKETRRPCARCNKRIDYDGTYFIPGTRKKNPRYLCVGHIVERDRALQLGWTEAEVNHPSNLQPECSDCSNKSGSRYARSKQKLRPVKNQLSLDNSRDW